MTRSPGSIGRCRSFRELPEPACRALADVAREVRFRRRDPLIPRGQPPQRLLVLAEGLASLSTAAGNGLERILHVHRPDDLVGATVMLEHVRHDYEVVAMTPAAALAIERRDLLAVGRQHPSIILAVAREVSRLLSTMSERVMAATSADVPVRLSQLLLDFAQRRGDFHDGLVPLTHRLTHDIMAQIVGASRPYTTTILRDLEERGAVQRGSRRGLLVRPQRLAEIVSHGFGDDAVY